MTLREENVCASARFGTNRKGYRGKGYWGEICIATRPTYCMEVSKREKAKLETSIREVRERMAVISSVEESMQASAKEVMAMAEKEPTEQQLQSVLVEL